MRDIETIDGELGFVAALRRAARELCNDMPSTVLYIDALLDELFGNSSVLTPPKLRRLAPVAVEPAQERAKLRPAHLLATPEGKWR